MGTSETLRSIIDAGRSGKRLDELTAARVIGKAAERVHAAQQMAGPGKAVGPITPSAIAIDPLGVVTLDMGKRGSTLQYSAPEQTDGSAGDRRSDVFSLGVIMWEALTHQRLFDAMNDAAVKAAVGEREIKAPHELNANVPPELSAMCMKALSRTSAERYASVKVMGVEIEEFLSEAGYADNASRLVAYFAEMRKAKTTSPPPSILRTPGGEPRPSANGSSPPANARATPMPDSAVPTPVEPSKTQPLAGLASLASIPTAPAKPTAEISAVSAKPAAAEPEPAAPSKLASSLPPIESVAAFAPPMETSPAASLVPSPPVLPVSPMSSKMTISGHVPAAAKTNHSEPAKPSDGPKLDSSVLSSAPTLPVSAIPDSAQTIPDGVALVAQTIPDGKTAKADEPVPETAKAEGSSRKSLPPAADPVSLPRTRRDSEGVLAKWAWQTDSTEIVSDDEDYHPPASRKPLYYMIGAGCGVALIVTIIALAGSGGSDAKKPPATAKATTEPAATAPVPAPAPDPAPAPAVASGADPAGSAGSATEPAKPEPEAAAESAKAEAAKAEAAKAEAAKAEVAKAEAAKAEAAKAEAAKAEAAKAEAAKAEAAKAEAAKADAAKAKAAKAEAAKAEAAKAKTEPKVVKTEPKTEPAKPKQVAKAEPAKPKVDVDAVYKQGLQQFARGDTRGALASLRTALAGNPNYSPTWRGLGLVYEKLGDKDQARAAYKRYLSLSPGASDADQIRDRMEKL